MKWLNNIDSNYLQIILPKLKTSTKKENYELSKISNVKKLRILKNWITFPLFFKLYMLEEFII